MSEKPTLVMAADRHRLIRQALEEMVMCPMCRGRLQNPRLLRCHHSACLQCLVSWHQASPSMLQEEKEGGEDDIDTVSCPTCRTLHYLPPGGIGVHTLPADFNKNILLDILDSTAGGGTLASSRSYCTVCDITGRRGVGAKTPATAFCNNCRDHLCAPCLEEHNGMPLLEEHTVVVTPHGSHLSVLMCRDHRNKSLDFFCHNCTRLICSICLRTTHRDHLAEGADDVSETRKREILSHKRAMLVRLAALKADGRAFNIDRRASAKHRVVASFNSQPKNSFDVVSAVATLESLVQLCDYLLTQADPGEVVAAADHVRARAETLLTETAPDDFTDRIIALLCRSRPEPLLPTPNTSRTTGTGSLHSDDRSSDVTDDASFIGSDPGGAVTDLEDNLEELLEEEEDEVAELERDALEGGAEAGVQGHPNESGVPTDADPSVSAVRRGSMPGAVGRRGSMPGAVGPRGSISGGRRPSIREPRSDVNGETTTLLWRCSMNGPDVGQVDGPWDVAFTRDGDVITTEAVNNRVQMFSDLGRESRILMSGFEPRGVTVGPDGTIAVVDHTRHCLRLLPPGGGPEDVVLWTPEHVGSPEVLAFAPNGYRVVTDAGKHVVAVYNADGEHLHTIGERGHGNGQFRQPLYVSVSSKGKVVVGDLHNNRIQAFTLDGKYLGKAGKRGSGDGNLYYPRGVCWDGSDHVVVADSNNSRVTVFDHDGRWMRHLLTDQQGMRKTRGVCVAPSGGETLVAVTDRDNEYSSLTVWTVQ